jgi:hypothetical protein
VKGVKGREEKSYGANKTQQLDTFRKYTINLIMEVEFRINKYTQTCNPLKPIGN